MAATAVNVAYSVVVSHSDKKQKLMFKMIYYVDQRYICKVLDIQWNKAWGEIELQLQTIGLTTMCSVNCLSFLSFVTTMHLKLRGDGYFVLICLKAQLTSFEVRFCTKVMAN